MCGLVGSDHGFGGLPHPPVASSRRRAHVRRAAGHTNPAIARDLFVSESAVSKHISSIFTKLQLVEDPSVDRRVRAVLAYVTGATQG